MNLPPILLSTLLLLSVMLPACSARSCAGAGANKLDRLLSQLQGGCCEYSTIPTDDQPDDSCKAAPSGLMVLIFQTKQECILSAARCLGQMGPAASPAVPRLSAALRSGPSNYDTGDGVIPVRDAIVEALGRTGDPRAVPVLLDALAHPRPVEAGPGAAGYTSPEPVGQQAALEALGHLGPVASPALPAVLPYLERPIAGPRDLRIVEAAARALAAIQDPAAIPPLVKALGREQAQSVVAAALGSFGPAAHSARPALIRIVEQAPDGEANTQARAAIRNILGAGADKDLPPSYGDITTRIVQLLRQTAKAHRIRLNDIRIHSPSEEVSVGLPGGARLHVSFPKQAWINSRAVNGTLTVHRPGAQSKATPFAGLSQLESLAIKELALLVPVQ